MAQDGRRSARRGRRGLPELNERQVSAVLENVFEQCGVEPNSVPLEALSAYTVYRRERFHLQRRILIATIAIFLLMPFLFIETKYSVELTEEGTRRLPAYAVRVSSLLPVQSVTAQMKNRRLPVYEEDTKTYTIEPTRNGKLEITVSMINRQRTASSVEVTGVDSKSPELVSSAVVDGQVKLSVRDGGIGVDFDEIYATTASGAVERPLETDESQGTVVFAYPTETWDVYIPDHIGNALHIAMRITEEG